jgi:hypothetical protein
LSSAKAAAKAKAKARAAHLHDDGRMSVSHRLLSFVAAHYAGRKAADLRGGVTSW